MRTVELVLDNVASGNYFIREAFNTLRTNILFSGKNVKVIVVTSCFAHEGKTSVSFDLCSNLAEAGKKVLLVDADLRKSVMVSRYTKEKGVYGLSQVLSGQVSAEEAICATSTPNMNIIFAGPYPPNPTELVGSEAFKDFIKEEREKYDYVIIDAAPLGMVIDAAVMASYCDGAVIVINTGRVKYRVAQNVKAQIEKSGCKVLGVVLNQIDKRKNIKTENSYYAAYSHYGNELPPQHQQSGNAQPASAKPAQPAVRPAQSAPSAVAQPGVARPRPTAPNAAPAARPTQPTQSAQPAARPAAPTSGPVRRPVPPAGTNSGSNGQPVRRVPRNDEKQD